MYNKVRALHSAPQPDHLQVSHSLQHHASQMEPHKDKAEGYSHIFPCWPPLF